MKKLSIVALAMALTLAMACMSFGATATGILNVSATVVATCSVSTTAVNFGNYQGADLYSTGDVAVTCSQGTPYNIALDAGQNFDGSRKIGNGVDAIPYALCQYGPCVGQWGDASYGDTYSAGYSLADTGNGASQSHTVYGWLLGTGPVSPGNYTDVVNVTVYY
jgi:spore coat protein U-like protein